ncbi:MAG: carboxypeptidase-like regulatory domain-containing protein [Bacteroidota bacterium]
MTTEQENKFSMQLTTRDFLTTNATITATLPNYAGIFTAIQTGITQIQSIREQQEFDKTGIAANKAQLKTSLIATAIDVARKTKAYATLTNNVVLLKEVDYTESDLKKSADTILKDICQVIYSRANANLAALATYGVSAATLTSLLNLLNSYSTWIPKPKLGIADKKIATEQLASLIKTLDDNFNKIDALVEIIRSTQPAFYSQYKNVRRIIASGSGSLSAKGKITDMASGDGLKGATITFMANADNKKTKASLLPIVKKSANMGGFNIKTLAEGSYNVTISKAGYKDAVVTVYVNNSELSVLDVALEKK